MIEGFGPQSPVSMAAFDLADNTVSAPVAGPTGRSGLLRVGQAGLLRAEARRGAKPRPRRRDSGSRDGARRQRADALAAQLKTAPNFQAAAKGGRPRSGDDRTDRARCHDPEHRPQPRNRSGSVFLGGGHREQRDFHAAGRGHRESRVTPGCQPGRLCDGEGQVPHRRC